MKVQDLHIEAGIYNKKGKTKDEPLALLYSILKDDIDNASDLENFFQNVVQVAASIVSAHSSKLVLFRAKELEKSSSLIDPEKINRTDHSINIPLFLRGLDHPMGYIEVNGKRDGSSFDLKDEVFLSMMGRQATLKIENDLFYRGIYDNMIEMLKTMVNIIESRDPYIRCHSSRVTQYALKIAIDINLSIQELNILRIASLLHDIGKIGIPDSILIKEGKLTREEWDKIKTHCLIGENIVKPLAFLSQEGKIIRSHHECYDGSGYPDGLKGEEIPLSARIISVADSYDAMTSHRPYRKAKSPRKSLDEIIKLKGMKYDPRIVQSFKRCLER
jgi:HD-GYP domain-containing protein (c-di-GMP phosphodiesterase class II)